MLVLSLEREGKVAGEAKLLQALSCLCSLLYGRISTGVFVHASISEFLYGEELAASVQKDLCQKKGKGDLFCEDVFLVASSDKRILVNRLVYGELHSLENIIEK